MRLFDNYRKKKYDDAEFFTPDFEKMLRIVFWNSLGFFFFMFIIPQVTDTLLEEGGVELGFVYSAQIFGALLSSPLAGWLTDKKGTQKKLLVLIGSFGRGISYIIMYIGILLESIWMFGFGTFFLGFSVAQFWPPFDALISQKSYKTKRSTAFGRRFGLMGLGNLFGSLISIVVFVLAEDNIALKYSPLILFCVANIYAGLVFYKRVDESITFDGLLKEGKVSMKVINLNGGVPLDDEEQITSKKLPRALVKAFLVFAIVIFFSAINQTIADPFTQVYVRDNVIIDDKLLSILNNDDLYLMLIYLPGPLLAQILSPILGRVADNINVKRGMPVISTLGAIYTFILINLRSGWSFGLFLLIDITFALSGNLIFQNFLSRISKAHRGKMFAMFSWVSRIGATIGPIIGGIMFEIDQVIQFGSFSFNLYQRIPFIISIIAELSLIPFFLIAFRLLQPHLVEKVETQRD